MTTRAHPHDHSTSFHAHERLNTKAVFKAVTPCGAAPAPWRVRVGAGWGVASRGRGDLRGSAVHHRGADDAATRTHLRTRGSKVWLGEWQSLVRGLLSRVCSLLLAKTGTIFFLRSGYFPQDWSSLPAGTPSGGRVGLRLELAWLDRAETPC